MNKTGKRSLLIAAALLAGACAFTISAAQADLTIVSQINITGLPTPGARQGGGEQNGQQGQSQQRSTQQGGGQNQQGGQRNGQQGQQGGGPQGGPHFPQTVTMYVQGSNVRSEVKDGPVRIYNGERQRTYVLDPQQKTYWIEDQADSSRPNPFGRLKVDSTVTVKASGTSGTVAGQKAQKYDVAGGLTISFQRNDDNNSNGQDQGQQGQQGPGQQGQQGPGQQGQQGPGQQGQQGQGGWQGQQGPGQQGQQGPGQQGPGQQGQQGQGGWQGRSGRSGRGGGRGMPTGPITVAGELWVASGDTNLDKSIVAAMYSPLVPGGPLRRFAEPILTQLATASGLPLKSSVAITTTMRGEPVTITTTYTVQTIDTTNLDASKFKVPDDYEEVDPPTFGRQGRRGGQDGQGGGQGQGNGQGGDAPPPPPNEN